MATTEPRGNASDSDDDSVDDDEDESECSLQVGFAEKVGKCLMFEDLNWNNWDGGRIGGKPFWLNKKSLPSPKTLQCTHCTEPMSFVLQIYCPLDDVSGAFHRMLYLFCCKQAPCVNKGSIKVLRCQLPQKNPFYTEIAGQKRGNNDNDIQGKPAKLCAVCGCNAPLICGACKLESYCSKSHQKLAWKAEHKEYCARNRKSKSMYITRPIVHASYGCVFPSYEIDVCDASELDDDDVEVSNLVGAKQKEEKETIRLKAEAEATLKKLEQATQGKDARSVEVASEMNEMATMRQKDIVAREGVDSNAMRDTTTFNFMVAVAAAKDQVLRYQRWCSKSRDGPLWIKSESTLESDGAPPCPCGAPRKFEFQVMPQLVHFLGVSSSSSPSTVRAEDQSKEQANLEKLKEISLETLDWGVLAVYTCTASCDACPNETESGLGGYTEEFVWRQPPL